MNDTVHVAAWASTIDNNGAIWMSHFGINGVFRYDINRREMESFGFFPDVTLDKIWLHQNAKHVGDYVFFVPMQDRYLRRINVFSREMESIGAPCDSGDSTGLFFVGDGRIIYKSADEKVYLSDAVDIVFEENAWLTEVCHEFKSGLDPATLPQSYHNDRKYSMDHQDGKLMLWYRDKLRLIDVEEQSVVDVNLNDKSTFQVFLKDNELWITHYYDCDIRNIKLAGNDSIVYSGENVEWKELENSDKIRPYSKLLITDEVVYVPNYRAKTIYKIDKKNSVIEEAFTDIKNVVRRTQWSKGGLDPDYFCAHFFENRIYFIPDGTDKMVVYDTNTDQINYYEFDINRRSIPYIGSLFSDRIKKMPVDELDEMFDIELLVDYVCSE